jgi:small nuclear ribonucleoprotein (snRNP)-like protein
MLKLDPQWDFLLSSTQRMLNYGHLTVSVLLKDGRRFDGTLLNPDGNLATLIRDSTGQLVYFDNNDISQIDPWPALPGIVKSAGRHDAMGA